MNEENQAKRALMMEDDEDDSMMSLSFQSALSDSALIERVTDNTNDQKTTNLSSSPPIVSEPSYVDPPRTSSSSLSTSSSSSSPSCTVRNSSGNTSRKSIQNPSKTTTITNNTSIHNKAQHVSFNQDRSCVAMALDTGYRIHTVPYPKQDFLHMASSSTATADAVAAVGATATRTPSSSSSTITTAYLEEAWKNKTQIHQVTTSFSSIPSSVLLCCMLHETSFMAMVQQDTSRILSFIHAKTGSILHQLHFRCAVIRIEMNPSTIIVVTNEGRLHCFSFYVSILETTTSSSKDDTDKYCTPVSSNLYPKNHIHTIQQENITTTTTRYTLNYHHHDDDSTSSNHRFKDIHIIHRFSIHLIAPNENIRGFITSVCSSNTGAFFDLSSHCFHGHSWLVTKSDSSVGYISLYDTSIPMNSMNYNRDDDNTNTTSKHHPPLGWIFTRKAHEHSIIRITVGSTIFATASEKVSCINIHIFGYPFFVTCFHLYPNVSFVFLLGYYDKSLSHTGWRFDSSTE